MDQDALKFEILRADASFSLRREPVSAGEQTRLVLTLNPEGSRPDDVVRLERELTLTTLLDTDWAIIPRRLVRFDGRLALVLDDPGGELLAAHLRFPHSVPHLLRIAVGLAAALKKMHAAGLLHLDVKPDNIMLGHNSQVWLTGFGSAVRREGAAFAANAPPRAVAGTLPYMAPEQTGRVNRAIDERSDLYALGITYYEMFGGRLPFEASSPAEWIHAHVARDPFPLHQCNPAVPPALEAIINKLLSKVGDDRYHSAESLESDLRRCLNSRVDGESAIPFRLAADEGLGALRILDRLYGREEEARRILSAFEGVLETGESRIVLISGEAGSGKSALVAQLQKSISKTDALFAAGKFDQFKRGIPYATIAQAFRSLVRRILGMERDGLNEWRDRLRESLGTSAGLLVKLVPELSHLVGDQLPVMDLQPHDARNRVHLVFGRFLQAFARPGRPLVLFIDDLQWLDEGTIELLERLVGDQELSNVLLISAFRAGEIEPRLNTALEGIANRREKVLDIALTNLAFSDVERLLTDAMGQRADQVAPLAELVLQKTGGNPYFVVEFVRALHEERLIYVDAGHHAWRWDLDRIDRRPVTDNVAELLADKLVRLPAASREVLEHLACMGSETSATMLSITLALPPAQVAVLLEDAVEARLLKVVGENYAFVHDRVQEAAYGLIGSNERQVLHAALGHALLSGLDPVGQDEHLFDIADHFSRGAGSVEALPDPRPICQVYLAAARRAKLTSAYVSALRYVKAGLDLLSRGALDDNDLLFALELELAECELLTGSFADAESRLLDLSGRARDRLEKADVVRVQSSLYLTLGQLDRAVETDLEYLKAFGIDWPAHPAESLLDHEIAVLRQHLAGRTIESLVDLPLLRDPDWLAAMNVLGSLHLCAELTDLNLEDLVLLRMANLSLEMGVCDPTSLAYANLTLVLGLRYGEYELGRRFGQVGCALVDQRGLTRFRSRTYCCFSSATGSWTIKLDSCLELLRQNVEFARSEADLVCAAATEKTLVASLLFIGAPLAEVEQEAEQFLELSRGMNFFFAEAAAITQLLLIRDLRGNRSEVALTTTTLPQVNTFEREMDAAGLGMRIPQVWHWVRQLQVHYHRRDYAAALELDRKIRGELDLIRSFIEPADYHFYAALSHAQAFDAASAGERRHHRAELDFHCGKLEIWGESCPENFKARATLVAAEIARTRSETINALRLYEQAASLARDHALVHVEAIAAELTAHLLIDSGCSTSAEAHLRVAHDSYTRWGADAIAQRLERSHPQLRARGAPAFGTGTRAIPLGELDMMAVVQMSQAVSSEIVFERLIERLMVTLVEHAVAGRGLLLLPRAGQMCLVAEAFSTASGVQVVPMDELDLSGRLPRSVLNYVVRTREVLSIDDVRREGDFTPDPYFRTSETRAVLCLPLKKQGRVVGILYFDNELSPDTFTAERIEVLQLLASQAAISIENAELFRSVTEAQQSARQASDELRIAYDSMPALAWRASPDGRFEFANRGWHDYTGVPYDHENLNDAWRGTIHPDDVDEVFARWRHHIQQASAGEVEARLRRHDGSFRRFLLRVSPMHDGDGNVLKWHGTSTDVEEIKLAGEAQQALARSSRLTALGELTVSISHEVNQPLMAIVTNGATCMRCLDADPINIEEARRAAERIVRDGHRAGEVIASIRSMARKNAAALVRIDLSGVISEVLQLTRNELERNSVQTRTYLSEAAQFVVGDRVQIQQVVLNLVLNCIEAMGTTAISERSLTISSTEEPPNCAVVSVTDSGSGLDPAACSKVFDAFYTTKPDGVGIGLSICRSIVERHGGDISAYPNHPSGTTFRFSLPLAVQNHRREAEKYASAADTVP
jgi:PAS domain S-box-containing protein